MQGSTTQQLLLKAHGRCTGALIFAIFGGCWLLVSTAYFHHFHGPVVVAICGIVVCLLLACRRVQRGQPQPQLTSALAALKRRDDRTFGIINGVTYTLVFLLFAVLPRFGLQNYIFPAFVALVGLHFLPMPRTYRHLANTLTGLAMVIWAVFCALAFKADGNRMAAYVALGAAGALWFSSLSALWTAHRLFTSASSSGDAASAVSSSGSPSSF